MLLLAPCLVLGCDSDTTEPPGSEASYFDGLWLGVLSSGSGDTRLFRANIQSGRDPLRVEVRATGTIEAADSLVSFTGTTWWDRRLGLEKLGFEAFGHWWELTLVAGQTVPPPASWTQV